MPDPPSGGALASGAVGRVEAKPDPPVIGLAG